MLQSHPATEPAPVGEHVVWEDAFSAAELDWIERYGDGLSPRKAELAGYRADYDSLRVTQVSWVERNSETDWLYQRLEAMVLRLNEQFFRYELYGLTESFQYAVYDGARRGHFDWHKDHGNPNHEPRKISLSLQLSDGDAYKGCDLELHGDWLQAAPRKRGTLIAFPSYMLHRVTPIESGIRKSLVIWAAGPEFR